MAESVLGKPIKRFDGPIKVMGRAKFITDLYRPGMLWGKVLFSDRPHAMIKRIDTSKARALEGVHAVVTAEDAPAVLYGLYVFDRYIFARDRVRHIGEPVAAVAAESKKIAEKALKLIEVEYDDLPAILNIEDALKPAAIQIHPDVEDYGGVHPYIKYGNLCMDTKVAMGDIEKGFAEADFIFEHTYKTNPMHQASLEPHACMAELDNWDKLTVWTGTQQLSVCHTELAKSLDMPMTKVRVIPAWMGGGFGGKLKSMHEPICALLAMKARRPVKLEMTREEEFTVSHPRAGFTIHMKTGVMKDGTLIAKEVDVLSDVGAYSDHALGMVTHAVTYAQGPYDIPNVVSRGRAIYTNNPDWGCMRGYGGLEIAWATEGQMDVIAKALDMDPVELRKKNLVKEGQRYLTTQVMKNIHPLETLEKAVEVSGYNEKKGKMGKNRGIGFAMCILNSGFFASSAFVKVNVDGTVSVLTAITDFGTGNLTALSQIAAETLGVPFESVAIAEQDSEASPYDTGSIASRTIFDAGNAIRKAALDARRQITEIAAISLECDPADIEIEDGWVFDRNYPSMKKSVADISFEATFIRKQGPILGRGAILINPPFDHEVGEGFSERPVGSYTFTAHVVEVEVDLDTGKVKVLNYTACHDVGKVINQAGIEGQVEGGVVQGIGYGMFEELIVKDGKIINPSFVDYRLPTALDTNFDIKSVFLEIPEPNGPFGAKGMSEPPMIPPPPALANAILDAIGVHVAETPFTPERLFWAIREQKRPA